MPIKPLTSNPSLDHFKHQARDLQKAQRAGDPEANQRIREFHPRLRRAAEEEIVQAKFTLADAQVTIAREYGFTSWSKLRAYLDSGKPIDETIPLRDRIEDQIFRHAVELIDAGDERGLRTHLAAHPDLIRRRVFFFPAGGYFDHPTLLAFVAENPIRNGTLPANIVSIVAILLEAGADANDGTLGLVTSGRVPREYGVQVPLIDFLCANGAKPQGAVGPAVTHGEFAAVEALVRNGATVDLPTAAALGHLEEVKRLFPAADQEARHRAMAWSAQHGRLEVLRFLLDQGEDPSRYNPLGSHSHSTPLHQAVVFDHPDVVRLLVDRGARLDLKDTIFHGTPLGWAEHEGKTQIAEYLRSQET
jgi:hypothetical protein